MILVFVIKNYTVPLKKSVLSPHPKKKNSNCREQDYRQDWKK
jgi:hypothetical protein